MIKLLKLLSSGLGALFWILLMLGFDDISMTALTLLAAAIHEIGHIFAIYFTARRGIFMPYPTLNGLRLKTGRTLSYNEEICVCLFGPLFNLICFMITLPFFKEFALINLITAISNLLPMPSYDGEKILFAMISKRWGPAPAHALISNLVLITSCCLCLLSLFLILKLDGGYWIFFVFFAIFLKQIFFFQNHTKIEE
ncbi:MAG: hypothetical protein J6Q68_00150 [Clostridia bacterium]|nr:hypothetical protein [Clostridia bacterium]